MSIVKYDLAKSIAKKTGLKIKESVKVLDIVIDDLQAAFTSREMVILRDIGTFKPVLRKGRKGQSFKNGTIDIPAHWSIKFEISKGVRLAVNNKK